MPSVELSKLQAIGGARALASGDRTENAARSSQPSGPTTPGGDARGVSIELGGAASIEAGQPPIDADRVAEIRKALEEGRYPLIPTKIADAMIAARIGLGIDK